MGRVSKQSEMDTESPGKRWLAKQLGPGESNRGPERVQGRSVVHLALAAFLLVIALAVRIHYLDTSLHVAEVQFRAALIARGYFFEMTDSIPDWRREANANSIRNLPTKEPSITEFIVALIYRFVGQEDLRIPRALASVFWLVGGVFLYSIVRKLTSRDAAVVTVGYYSFLPLGVVASTSFQPDSLMIMMFVISIYTVLRFDEQPSMLRLTAAALASALAIFVKPLVLFTISGTFISLMVYRKGSLRRAINSRSVIYFVLSLLPAALYYGFGILAGGSLATQAQGSFLPQLWLTRDYWRRWLLTAAGAVELTPLILALLGISMWRHGAFRALLIGLWGGYAVFCLVFTYHIRFAGYYHLQLAVIVALSLAPVACLVLNRLKRSLILQWYWLLPVFMALLVAGLFTFREISGAFSSAPAIEDEEISKEIGDMVSHSKNTVYIASYYGRPLEYYGELSGAYWPRSLSGTDRALGRKHEQSVQERLDALDFTPEYFVITNLGEYYAYHTDLEKFLTDCPLVSNSDDYLIYEACAE